MTQKPPISVDSFAEELIHISGLSDRVRLVGLDNTNLLAAADEGRLQRELARQTAKYGQESVEVQDVGERLRMQQVLKTQLIAERQRAETVPPERRPDRYIVHGRVVDRDRLGQEGLTVTGINRQGKPGAFTCTDARGYFKFEAPVERQVNDGEQPESEEAFLQVSDKNQVILYRGEEAFTPTAGEVLYREIVLGDLREKPCPPPPETDPIPKTVRVPDVVGQKEVTANAILDKASLTIGTRQTKPTTKDQIDRVVAQDPSAGSEVDVGTAVSIVIGVPMQKVKVPNLVGQKEEPANDILAEAKLKIGTRQTQPVHEAQVGIVLAQNPKPGSEVDIGSAVNMVIGVLLEQVQVPNVKDQNVDQVENILKKNGLILGEIRTRVNKQDGTVLDQDPQAGTQVDRGTAVNLVVGRLEDQGLRATIVERMSKDETFEQIGISTRALQQRLKSLNVDTKEQFENLVKTENKKLQKNLQLRTLKNTQACKRIMKKALKELTKPSLSRSKRKTKSRKRPDND